MQDEGAGHAEEGCFMQLQHWAAAEIVADPTFLPLATPAPICDPHASISAHTHS